MRGYWSSIGKALPFVVQVEVEELADLISLLIAPRAHIRNGSSFAVTVDTGDGFRCLWLSQTSAERLKGKLGARIYPAHEVEGEYLEDKDRYS